MDYSLSGSSIHGIFQVRVLEWIAIYFLLQGIFPTQELKPGLPHCKQTLYRLSHQAMLPLKNNKIHIHYKRSRKFRHLKLTFDNTKV